MTDHIDLEEYTMFQAMGPLPEILEFKRFDNYMQLVSTQALYDEGMIEGFDITRTKEVFDNTYRQGQK